MMRGTRWFIRKIFDLVLAFLICSSWIDFSPERVEAGAVRNIETTVNIISDSFEMSSDGFWILTFEIIITCDGPIIVPMEIDLTVIVSVGNATMEKTHFVLHGHNPEDSAKGTMIIPLKAQKTLVQMTISGTWTQGPFTGPTGAAQAAFLFGQYHDIRVSLEDSVVKVRQGEKRALKLNITNAGNYRDELEIEVSNEESLKGMGIKVERIPPFWLEFEESRDVRLNFSTSESTPIGLIPIGLQVSSTVDSNASEEVTIYLDVQEGGLFSILSDLKSSSYLSITVLIIVVSILIAVITKRKEIRVISKHISFRK